MTPSRRRRLGLTAAELQDLHDNPPTSTPEAERTSPAVLAWQVMADPGTTDSSGDFEILTDAGWSRVDWLIPPATVAGVPSVRFHMQDGAELVAPVEEPVRWRRARLPYRDVVLSGGSIAYTERRDYADGRRVVIKTAQEWETHAEYLASLVGQAIGAPVPDVILAGPREVWMGYAGGSPDFGTGVDLAIRGGDSSRYVEWERQWAGSEPAWRLALLDLLTMNGDRHGGNWMVEPPGADPLVIDPSTVVGIDHNRSWMHASSVSPPAPEDPPPQWVRRHTGTEVALLDPDDHDRWRTDLLSPQEAEQIDARLRDLEDEFRRLGREEWYEQTIAHWEQYLHGLRGGDGSDPEEGARVATARQILQRIADGQTIQVRFTAEDLANWTRMGAPPPPGWHLVTETSPVRGAAEVEIKIEPSNGSIIWLFYAPDDPITYRVVQ